MKLKGTRTSWLIVVLVVVGAGWFGWRLAFGGGGTVSFRTVPVTRGNVVATIGATGSLEPEEAVDVGAQVAGRISRFGTENGKPIDRCSTVKAGDLLAQIDPSLYKMDLQSAQAGLAQGKAQLEQSQAQLAQSEAQVKQSDASVLKAAADVEQMQAKEVQAEEDWSRARNLREKDVQALAESAYDAYKAEYLTAEANLASAKAGKVQADAAKAQALAGKQVALATVALARAAIEKAQADVDRAQQNLDYCTITSPVDGVVIDRRVNIGQTVVSSLNAPSLFLIAKDLTRMQIWVSVNEADIGKIHVGQPVSFTVDARPGVTFHGKVTKVRFDASMTQNVVTYPVEVQALNPDGLLYPYMTATVHFELARRSGVLEVPNAALRYEPSSAAVVAPSYRSGLPGEDRSEAGKPEGAAGAGKPGGAKASKGGDSSQSGGKHRDAWLWVRDGKFVRPIEVRAGLTDGTKTEVTGRSLKKGLEVVTSETQKPSSAGGSERSPFLPRLRRH